MPKRKELPKFWETEEQRHTAYLTRLIDLFKRGKEQALPEDFADLDAIPLAENGVVRCKRGRPRKEGTPLESTRFLEEQKQRRAINEHVDGLLHLKGEEALPMTGLKEQEPREGLMDRKELPKVWETKKQQTDAYTQRMLDFFKQGRESVTSEDFADLDEIPLAEGVVITPKRGRPKKTQETNSERAAEVYNTFKKGINILANPVSRGIDYIRSLFGKQEEAVPHGLECSRETPQETLAEASQEPLADERAPEEKLSDKVDRACSRIEKNAWSSLEGVPTTPKKAVELLMNNIRGCDEVFVLSGQLRSASTRMPHFSTRKRGSGYDINLTRLPQLVRTLVDTCIATGIDVDMTQNVEDLIVGVYNPHSACWEGFGNREQLLEGFAAASLWEIKKWEQKEQRAGKPADSVLVDFYKELRQITENVYDWCKKNGTILSHSEYTKKTYIYKIEPADLDIHDAYHNNAPYKDANEVKWSYQISWEVQIKVSINNWVVAPIIVDEIIVREKKGTETTTLAGVKYLRTNQANDEVMEGFTSDIFLEQFMSYILPQIRGILTLSYTKSYPTHVMKHLGFTEGKDE